MTQQWHLAQLNVGTILHPADDPRMQGFYSRLDAINALAEASPGFVWRLQSDSGNATDIQVADDPMFLVNLSVWESAEALFEYVYRSAHREVMAGRRQWFARPEAAHQVLWWVAAGHQPSTEEALARLSLLRRHGPTAEAFTFKARYPAPDQRGEPDDYRADDRCAGWD